jgi:HD superfamily phosphohydrolase
LYKTGFTADFTWKMISDPLYSYVYFNVEVEEPIINTLLLQRLRYIMQLQTAHLVYPGAVHTRFQHSIGVLHLSGVVAEDMVFKTTSLYGTQALEGYDPATLIEATRLAGLLHDVGHAAFSHAFEQAVLWRRKLPLEVSNHERIGVKLVELALGDYVDKASRNLPGLREVLLALLGVGEPRGVLRVFRWIVRDGPYPTDVLDFLRRDSYYAGTPEYGYVSYERLYKNTYPLISGDRVALVLDRIALGGFRQYMHAKISMYEHVYYHSVCRSFDKILYKVLEELDSELDLTGRVIGVLRGDLEGYLELTDTLLYSVMMRKALYEATGEIGRLCRRILVERKPEYRRVGREVILSARSPELVKTTLKLVVNYEYKQKVTSEIEEYLAERIRGLGLQREDIWVDVLDVTPLPRSLVYPGGESPGLTQVFYLGKKTGRSIVVSEEYNVLREEFPLEVIFRAYVKREKYEGGLEARFSTLMLDAVKSVLGIVEKPESKILEEIISTGDVEKYRLTM